MAVRNDSLTCKFNEGVVCSNQSGQTCAFCGWNPEVAKARLNKTRYTPSGNRTNRK